MQTISGLSAYAILFNGVRNRTFRMPAKGENGYQDGVLLPKLWPRFKLAPGEKIFTIGSCFAREIEKRLVSRGFDLPVCRYPVPDMLNEYNAGTILQRIESVFGGFSYEGEMGIEQTDKGYLDLFLHIHQTPVELPMLHYRRQVIAEIYNELKAADTVVITLGLTETWFDTIHQCYVNKAPSRAAVAREPDRFQFHRMDVADVIDRVSNSIALINANGQKKILLTVSPIPIEATFSGTTAIVANSYSKAVLRVVVEQMIRQYENVDYFPSFEIATSGGMAHYIDDNVHITEELVEVIINHMMANYLEGAEVAAKEEVIKPNYIDAEAYNRFTAG